MKPNTILQRMVVMLITLMCAIGANAAEAYACYTSSNTTLTFYYDYQRNSRPGTTYDLNSGSTDAGWDTDGTKADVTNVVFHSSFANARPTSTYSWFNNMVNLESITGLNYLNTSQVTNMAWMFCYCYKLTTLDLSSFNTSKVTTMKGMFYECLKLQTIYVGSGWTTNGVTNSEDMFYNCIELVGEKGTTYDESHVGKTYARIDDRPSNPGYLTDINSLMPYVCYTPENTTLTFYYDSRHYFRPGTTYNLNTGSNVPGWENDDITSNVTKVVFDSSFAAATPTSTYSWFYGMTNLRSITGLSYLNTSRVTNMSWMFAYCSNLTNLDLSSFDTSKVTTMEGMFSDCVNLNIINMSSFNTSKVTDMRWMFIRCSKLQTIYVCSNWSTAEGLTSTAMFYECSSLKGGKGTTYNANYVDATYARIDGGTSSKGYFTAGNEAYACYGTAGSLRLTFYYDNQRSTRTGKTYDLNTGSNEPGWYTDNTCGVVFGVVFDSSFADARPTTTYSWFSGMNNLKSIEGMKYLNTSEVSNMESMFSFCKEMESLDLSHFNTSNVTSMSCMFAYCSKLESIDLSKFNTSNVTSMFGMFEGCTKLQTIYVDEGWSTASIEVIEVENRDYSNYMFSDCISLVGGKGTQWKETNPTNKTYAHIDGGSDDPGYFTERTTGIATDLHQVISDKSQVISDEWYDLSGRKLNGQPTKKGVYIHNGKTVIR